MGATFSRVKTWIAEVLTASDLNAEFDNILNNLLPAGIDDQSVNDAAMQAVRDPYPGDAISKPTDLAGEIQGLRNEIKQIKGEAQWYIDPATSLLLEFNKGADIASATALVLGTDGNYFDVTGTTTITSIGTRRVGSVIRLHFDGAVLLTHHATDLVLPGGVNLTTQAGDEAVFIEYATGDWRMANYEPNLSAGSTGTGDFVRETSPTIVTPTIADLTNMTHDHADAEGGGLLPASTVDQGILKTTTGEVSTTITANLVLPGGEYGFYPQVKETAGSSWAIQIANSITTSYVTRIRFDETGDGGTGFAQQRYIQASPPYKIGDKVWGHFIFVLRNISTSAIISSYQAEDPPWAYNGNPSNAKDSVKRIQEVPHPFVDYWSRNPGDDGLEIVLLDLKDFDMKKYKEDSVKANKSPLENMEGNIIVPNKIKTRQELSVPEIVGFTNKVIFR